MNILKLLKKHRFKKAKTRIADRRFEIVLSGSGGQGMVLAGKMLAEAATIYYHKEALMTQHYGPEARGGESRAEIIISSDAIHFPKVMHVDVLLAMSPDDILKHAGALDANSLLITDELLKDKVPKHLKNVFMAPFRDLAVKLLGAPVVANIIALGAMASITGVVSRKALIRSVLALVPPKFLVLNRIAVDTGFKAVKDSGFKWSRTI